METQRDESGNGTSLATQTCGAFENILMKYYPTLLIHQACRMLQDMVKLDNSSFVVKGLGQLQKFGFGMKFYVGSADDLPL